LFKKFIFIFLLCFCYSTILVAQNGSWQCSFEEVYSDGQSNTGTLLINSNSLRYEYDRHDLYTLIYKLNGQLYSIPNFQTEQIQIIQNNEVLFQELIKIYGAFPSTPNEIFIDDFFIRIEKSKQNEFIKRIAIQSPNLNISLHFYNCDNKNINQLYFNLNPFYKIER